MFCDKYFLIPKCLISFTFKMSHKKISFRSYVNPSIYWTKFKNLYYSMISHKTHLFLFYS